MRRKVNRDFTSLELTWNTTPAWRVHTSPAGLRLSRPREGRHCLSQHKAWLEPPCHPCSHYSPSTHRWLFSRFLLKSQSFSTLMCLEGNIVDIPPHHSFDSKLDGPLLSRLLLAVKGTERLCFLWCKSAYPPQLKAILLMYGSPETWPALPGCCEGCIGILGWGQLMNVQDCLLGLREALGAG